MLMKAIFFLTTALVIPNLCMASGNCTLGNESKEFEAIDPATHYGTVAQVSFSQHRVATVGIYGDRALLSVQTEDRQAYGELPVATFEAGVPLKAGLITADSDWFECEFTSK